MLQTIVKICLDKHLNFSVFSRPGSDDFEIIIENPAQKAHSLKGFKFHPFMVSERTPSLFIPADFHFQSSKLTLQNCHLINSLSSSKTKEHLVEIENTNETEYKKSLLKGMGLMSQLNIHKYVYSRIKTVEKPKDLDLAKYILRLRESYKNAYIYLCHHEISGTWVGATPETLVSWSEGPISTMSLAGTLPKNSNKPNWSNKEIEEHNYVTKYIEKAFTNSNIPFQKGKTKTITAGPVYHLKTEIKSIGSTSFQKATNLVKSLHPTPAICGVPLLESKQLITSIEKHNRNYYTGYIGFFEPNKKLDFFVNLRCLQVLPKHLALYLGGGITHASDANKEWDETNFKAQTLLNALPNN
ncbi:MAG: chorismate-binding protein [Salibacteraceae bacterium]